MKRIIETILVVALAVIVNGTMAQENNYKVENTKSKVEWLGKKIGGQHNGTIGIHSATLRFEKGRLTAADVIMDMNTIVNLDLENQEYNQKLVGHLKSKDFFDVENHPKSSFITTEVKDLGNNTYLVSGDLNIKSIILPVSFEVYANESEGKAKAKATLIFDRSKYNIKYNSSSFFENLGDKVIYDDVEIRFDLNALIK
ncbi:MAG: YceI family protein [Bacteroidales bacterium]|nr:YceI family protein [Bacteroidales bacterium]